VLLAVAGETTCFFVNALSYVVVIVMLLRMEVVSRPRADALARRPLIEGVQYALDVASIRNLLLLLGVTCGLGFQYMTLLPVFARQILHAGPRAYGLMVASFGLGSLLSALWLTRHQDRWDAATQPPGRALRSGCRHGRVRMVALASAHAAHGVRGGLRAHPLRGEHQHAAAAHDR
jgi:hypothetical protein